MYILNDFLLTKLLSRQNSVSTMFNFKAFLVPEIFVVALAHLPIFDEWFKHCLLVHNLNSLNEFLDLETASMNTVVAILRASPLKHWWYCCCEMLWKNAVCVFMIYILTVSCIVILQHLQLWVGWLPEPSRDRLSVPWVRGPRRGGLDEETGFPIPQSQGDLQHI